MVDERYNLYVKIATISAGHTVDDVYGALIDHLACVISMMHDKRSSANAMADKVGADVKHGIKINWENTRVGRQMINMEPEGHG